MRLPLWVITGCPARRAVRPQEPRLQTSRRSKVDLTLDAQFNTYETRKKALRYIAKVQVLTFAFEGEGCS
jgi:hypothetical protein